MKVFTLMQATLNQLPIPVDLNSCNYLLNLFPNLMLPPSS